MRDAPADPAASTSSPLLSTTTSGHMLDDIRRPGAQVRRHQFTLAQHRVEVDPVAGHPDTGSDAERERDHAGVPVVVDDRDVGGVAQAVSVRG